MDYRKLDPDEYEILEGEKLENGIQQIILTDKKDRRFCEECLSADVVKKCQTTRKVLDVVDKKPVQYIITRYRIAATNVSARLFPRISMNPKCVLHRSLEDFLHKKCCRTT